MPRQRKSLKYPSFEEFPNARTPLQHVFRVTALLIPENLVTNSEPIKCGHGGLGQFHCFRCPLFMKRGSDALHLPCGVLVESLDDTETPCHAPSLTELLRRVRAVDTSPARAPVRARRDIPRHAL